VFGRTAERRSERQLIEEYLLLVEEICTTVTTDNRSLAIDLARLPEQIRGYGHVKERSIEAVRKQWTDLMVRYRNETKEYRRAS
jgi:indolepyruvate ferredoxin oxidoreductase